MPAKKTSKKTTTKKTTTKKTPAKATTKKETPAKSKKPSMREWAEKMAKDKSYKGKVLIRLASDIVSPYYLRRPTGVTTLDLKLGGGLHASGTIQVFGAESVGKTFLAYQTAGEVQRNYGGDARILIVCTEILPDKGFARQARFCMGYSAEEVDFFEGLRANKELPPFTPEERADLLKEIGEVAVAQGGTGDLALQGALQLLEDDLDPQLIIIESLGALLTPDQDAKDVGDRTYGGSSLMLTAFQNKLYPLLNMPRADGTQRETTVLGINQARANITSNPKAKKERVAAGAYAWRHGQLASIELGKGQTIYEPGSNNTKVNGREVRWTLTKGKAGTHDGIKGDYNYYHCSLKDPVFWNHVEEHHTEFGIDTVTDLVVAAVDVGVIEKNGAWLKWAEKGVEIGKAQGDDNFGALMVNNEELIPKLREACFRKADLPVKYK